MVVEDVVPHRVGVVITEPVAPVVAGPAELRLPRLCLDQSLVRLDTKIAAADVDGLTPPRCTGWPLTPGPFPRRGEGRYHLDDAARIAVGAVEPAVESPGEAVGAVLLVALAEAGEQDDLVVGLAVAVGVLGVEDVRSTDDDHALAPGMHAGGIAEVVEEDRGLVVGRGGGRLRFPAKRFRAGRGSPDSALSGFLEELDAAAGLVLAAGAEGIVAHLDDPELAVRPPGEGDGVHDERLGGHQLDREPGSHLDTLERLRRRLWPWLHDRRLRPARQERGDEQY